MNHYLEQDLIITFLHVSQNGIQETQRQQKCKE